MPPCPPLPKPPPPVLLAPAKYLARGAALAGSSAVATTSLSGAVPAVAFALLAKSLRMSASTSAAFGLIVPFEAFASALVASTSTTTALTSLSIGSVVRSDASTSCVVNAHSHFDDLAAVGGVGDGDGDVKKEADDLSMTRHETPPSSPPTPVPAAAALGVSCKDDRAHARASVSHATMHVPPKLAAIKVARVAMASLLS